MAAWAECTKKIQIFWNVCSLPLHSRLGVASTFSRDCDQEVRLINCESTRRKSACWDPFIIDRVLELEVLQGRTGKSNSWILKGVVSFSLRVTGSHRTISGWSHHARKALQAIASLPEKVHGRPARSPPIPD